MAGEPRRKASRRSGRTRGVDPVDGVEVAPSGIHGRGLFATRPIRKGATIGRFDGAPTRRDGPHVLWAQDAPGAWTGRRGTNVLRYVNHAADPNAAFWGWDLVALRRIRAGEEITVDYGEETD